MSISEGDVVEITLDAYRDKKFNGIVNKVYPFLNSRLRTRPFEVSINEKIKLLPGMFARLSIILNQEKDTVVIPNSALFTDKNGNYSAYVIEDGKAVSRKITKGIENAYNVQILKGISFKDKVIINGIEDLKENTVVKIISKDKKEGGVK
jgi:multidrug efflux pump subunit AcrA (membrane-fusion protein)